MRPYVYPASTRGFECIGRRWTSARPNLLVTNKITSSFECSLCILHEIFLHCNLGDQMAGAVVASKYGITRRTFLGSSAAAIAFHSAFAKGGLSIAEVDGGLK